MAWGRFGARQKNECKRMKSAGEKAGKETGDILMNSAARYLNDPPSLLGKLRRTGRHDALQSGGSAAKESRSRKPWMPPNGGTPRLQGAGGRANYGDRPQLQPGNWVRLRHGYGGQVEGQGCPPYMFLRNEPILFSRTFPCITRIERCLCGLQRCLQMGSFWKNEPIWRQFLSRTHRKVGSFSGRRTQECGGC
jgi:hypothetical protein